MGALVLLFAEGISAPGVCVTRNMGLLIMMSAHALGHCGRLHADLTLGNETLCIGARVTSRTQNREHAE